MKRRFLALAATLTLAAAPADAADKSSNARPAIPPAPKTPTLQIPPAPAARKAPAAAPSKAQAAREVTVAESRPYVSKGNTVQHFVDYINLKPGQERLPLTLTINNNGFEWLNLSIAGYPVLTHKDLRNKYTVPVAVTGSVSGGSSQVIIDAVGRAGSTLSWKLTAPTPELMSASPTEVAPGDTLTIKGKNFCPAANYNSVKIGEKTARVKGASATQLQVEVPDDAASGLQQLEVSVIGQKATGKAEVTVANSPPELTSMSLESGPPGLAVTIYGKNFSKKLGENKVFFGDLYDEIEAPVVSGDQNSLTVIIPDMTAPLYNVPVTVKVGKLKSKNSLTFLVQTRVF